jgi:hypothetical protein
MALRLNRVGGTAWPTREGSGHLVIPLGYLQSLGKHGQHHDHEGGGTHYLTNDVASMPNSIYSGAETHLITDRDNDSIKGMRTSAAPPPTLGRGSLVKSHMLQVKIHGQVRRQLIPSQASKVMGRVLATHHRPGWGKTRSGSASIPPPPIRELQVRVGEASPATPTTTKT